MFRVLALDMDRVMIKEAANNMMSHCTDFTVCLFVLLLSLVYVFVQRTIDSKKNHPPGPRGLPIIGNLHQLGTMPYRSLSELGKKYGPVLYLKLGNTPTVIISSTEAARQVLRTHELDCLSRPPMPVTKKLFYNCVDLAFTPFGEYWKEIRKICVLELLCPKRIQSFRYIREEEMGSLIESISKSASNGSMVDLSDMLVKVTANVTCRSAFGSMDNERFIHNIYEAIGLLSNSTFSASNYFPYFGWIIDRVRGIDRRVEACFKKLDNFYEEIIEDHLKKLENKQALEKEDILDLMLKMERDQLQVGPDRLTRNHVKAILMDIFLAGVDPIVGASIRVMSELVKRPNIMKKLQDEIRGKIGNKGSVTEKDIDKLEYLNLVIRETMRYHIAPFLVPREAASKIQINGYDIYPKTWIYVNVWAITRDPELWENPNEFIPERFINNSINLIGQDFELLAFGTGRRSCPGRYMATTMLEFIVANLLYHFNWEMPDGMTEKDFEPGFTNTVPLRLVPVKYKGI